MASLAQFNRLSNYVFGSYKTVFHGRPKWFPQTQVCDYTKKSAESKLGLDKPKRPLTPFFKFMTQMRPALLAKNPGISSKEAISWTSKHWQELDLETKNQMAKEYEKDLEDYKKIKLMYESSLTDKQKEEIQKLKEEMAAKKEKRQLKAELKELGRPKKPMSSYFLYVQSRSDSIKGVNIKEYQLKAKADWVKLTSAERTKFDKQAQELMAKYQKDLEAWELKMISLGRHDVVRTKPVRAKKAAIASTKQQQFGCSDEPSDSASTIDVQNNDKIFTSPKMLKQTVPESININPTVQQESICRSTGETHKTDDNEAKAKKAEALNNDQKESKNIFNRFKKFFTHQVLDTQTTCNTSHWASLIIH